MHSIHYKELYKHVEYGVVEYLERVKEIEILVNWGVRVKSGLFCEYVKEKKYIGLV